MSTHADLTWRKSSYSSRENNCVETAWRKSSYSSRANNCVETATHPTAVHVRDSKLGDAGPVLTATPAAWAGFLAALKQPPAR